MYVDKTEYRFSNRNGKDDNATKKSIFSNYRAMGRDKRPSPDKRGEVMLSGG